MIKIAVCDDEPVMCGRLEQMVASRLEQWDEAFRITCYTNAIQFLHSPLDYDLVFLDIQMPNLDGIELAKRLREKEFEGILIFVTVLKECVLDAFEVEAMDYLCKPVDEHRLERALKRSLRRLRRKEERYLTIRTMNWRRNVKLKDIYYCEVMNRKIHLHMKNGVLEYYGRIKEVEQQTAPDFIRCHRSFLVNPEHLSEYRNGDASWKTAWQILFRFQDSSVEFSKTLQLCEGSGKLCQKSGTCIKQGRGFPAYIPKSSTIYYKI